MFYHPILLSLVGAMVVTQVAVFVTTIYLHRGLAHRSLAFHPALDMFFRIILWITTGQKRQEWVAVHRKHHAFTDREDDPHSPRLLGFWHVQLGNVYYYIKEARNPRTLMKFASDITNDWSDRYIFSHTTVGPLAGLGLLYLFFGWWGIVMGMFHALLYVFVLSPSINGLCHWSGQKNFGNTAYNRPVLALVTAGEGLHNNHHGRPRRPKFSGCSSNEFDPAWPVIKWLIAHHLVELTNTVEMTHSPLK